MSHLEALSQQKPDIKDVKLAFKKCILSTRKKKKTWVENTCSYSGAQQQLIKAHSLLADRFSAFVGTQSITELEVASCSSPCHFFPFVPTSDAVAPVK